MTTNKPVDIDEYIAGFPKSVQRLLEQIRTIIKKAAPQASETIKYSMPTLHLQGNLVYFAAFKSHIGLYAVSTDHPAFKEELSHYKTGKGSVQFPFDQPLPVSLITNLIEFRVKEKLEMTEIKKQLIKLPKSTKD